MKSEMNRGTDQLVLQMKCITRNQSQERIYMEIYKRRRGTEMKWRLDTEMGMEVEGLEHRI